MELKQLEAFTTVVELKSFSKAAGKLFLTQPTVSTHIQSLEKELGTRLIMRNTKSLTLSESGEQLYIYAKEMIMLRDRIMSDFGKSENRPDGTITIAASTIPSLFVLPKILAEVNREFPEATFNLIKCDSGLVVKYLEEGKADIGLTGATASGSNCTFEPFAKDNLVIVTPNKEPYTLLKDFDKETLLQYPFITREEQSGTRKEYEHYLQSIGISTSQLNVVATMDSIDSIKSSIVGGLGISIMSAISVEDFHNLGLLRTFTLNETSIPRNLYIVKLKHRMLSGTAQRLLMRIRKFGDGTYRY